MIIKKNYVLRKISGDYYVIPRHEEADRLQSVIKINNISAFLWNIFLKESTLDSAVFEILQEYDTNEETAKQVVQQFIQQMEKLECFE